MFKDSTDEKIIGYLKEDSRVSFVTLGKKLHLSGSAVRRRVKDMMDDGILKKFTVELGDKDEPSAIVLISVDSATDTSKVSSRLTRLSRIVSVYEITGQYDITTIIRAPNIMEINACIDALRKIPGVADTNTVIILRKLV